MTRCPNCGSSVRTGAKFCTTCGFRLPIEAETSSESPSSRSPFDLTSSSTIASRWQQPSESARDAATSDAETAAVPETSGTMVTDAILAAESAESFESTENENGPVTSDETELAHQRADSSTGPSFSGWPSFGAAGGQGSGWDDVSVNGTEQKSAAQQNEGAAGEALETEPPAAWSSDPPVMEPEALSVDARSEESGADESVAGSTGGPDPNDLSAYSWLQSIDRTDTEDAESVTQQADDGAADVAESESDDAPSEEPAASTAGADDEPAMDEPVAAPAAAEAEQPTAAHERANRLLDELRALLPDLAGAGASSTAASDTANALAALLVDRGDEAERFQSLRAAVATAQARPRDVDIMLDLVARADTIAAVLSAHDRYVAGIEDAVATLRGESKDEPPPRW